PFPAIGRALPPCWRWRRWRRQGWPRCGCRAVDEPLETGALLASMFGAEGHLWSVGTLSAFMALEGCGTPEQTPSGLILAAGGSRARLRPGAQLLAFETLSS